MIKSATDKFIKSNIPEDNKIKVFYVKTDDGKDCSVVCNQTAAETIVSFIVCFSTDDKITALLPKNEIFSVLEKVEFDRYRVEKNKNDTVFIHSCRYAPGVAYFHREKNIKKTIINGINNVINQLTLVDIKPQMKGEPQNYE